MIKHIAYLLHFQQIKLILNLYNDFLSRTCNPLSLILYYILLGDILFFFRNKEYKEYIDYIMMSAFYEFVFANDFHQGI